MSEDHKQIEAVFKTFVESTLIAHNIEQSLSVITEDIIGIGMGNQGIVTNKADLANILKGGKSHTLHSSTQITYENIQIRCYEEYFGTICGILRIQTIENNDIIKSSLGQLMSVRKQDGVWRIYAIQATPLFNAIEEMEAYPIKFAESALEKYREQEQIAKNAQKDSLAIYRVNFTTGVFEDAILKNPMLFTVTKNESYEQVILQSSRMHLCEDEGYAFLSTFSIGNIIKQYQNGNTEVSMDYKMMLSKDTSLWMRTVIRLYMDKQDKHLKGYLYVFDIDEEKTKELELQYRAEHDALSDLYNKKHVEIKINALLKQITSQTKGVFFMLDLDHFKEINDHYGHQQGDMVIKKTAKEIHKLLRNQDIAGRLGGDEFCIYFHGNMSKAKTENIAQLLCDGIHRILANKEVTTSCSIGIVFCEKSTLSFQDIYQRADEALYLQKRKGRNGYTIVSL